MSHVDRRDVDGRSEPATTGGRNAPGGRHAPGGRAALAGVAPSILSADFARLGAQVSEVLEAGARVIHVDVMDGHFVPPITMGPIVVSALADLVHGAGGALDVHLMIERPERQVAEFGRAGADSITIHAEATPHLHYASARSGTPGPGPGSPSTRARRPRRSPPSPRSSTSRSA